MAHIPHYPLPPHLHEEVATIAELITKPGGAGNAVHVIAESLGHAYNAGHRDGQLQVRQLSWVVERLDGKLAETTSVPAPEGAADGRA